MTYANISVVRTLTTQLSSNNGSDKYEALLLIAIDEAEDTINNELITENVPIPTIPDPIDPKDPLNTLIKAANLFTAAFMHNTNRSSNDSLSPTAVKYEANAEKKLRNYIEIIHEGYNEETKEEETPLPKFASLI
ncbi:hypothetical protein [Methanobacterium spitsbergense]|uniref:Uncharacterized protein n=1 Tax=Methanobacterium spitsbergense TaxID=2874285 RepID=A0A8T5UQP1_9EURY|nr:hypothetical protein [Methanobacterium spitsbergense]MBZ2166302.1 hypothetical protein [Methanobacterium spitsbergense]